MSEVTLATTAPASPQPAWTGQIITGDTSIIMGDEEMLAQCAAFFKASKVVAVDTETGSAHDGGRWAMRCVTMATDAGEMIGAAVFDPRIPAQAEMIRDVLSSEQTEFVFHNASYDLPILTEWGLAPLDLCDRVYDTLVTARLMPKLFGKMSLSSLAERYLDVDDAPLRLAMDAAGVTGAAWFEQGDIDRYVYAASAARDTAVTVKLRDLLHKEALDWLTSASIQNAPVAGEAEQIIHTVQEASRAMLRLQCAGLPVNHSGVAEYGEKTAVLIEAADKKLSEYGIRPGVAADVVARMETDGYITDAWPRTPGGKLKADKKTLDDYRYIDYVDAHLQRAEVVKIKEDYLDKFHSLCHPRTGKIYPVIGTLGACQTGRQSATTPPIQQIPAAARPMISTGDESWVSIDWSSVEPMLAAYVSGETWVTESVLNGGDLYVPIARRAGLIPADVSDEEAQKHPGRKHAKKILLGQLYGQGAASLALDLGVDEGTARSFRDGMMRTLPNIDRHNRALKDTAERAGAIVTAGGRVLPVDRDHSYKAVNFFHQGSATDLLMGVLVECKRLGIADQLRLTIHDEIVCTADVAEEVRTIMETHNPCMQRAIGHQVRFPTDVHPLEHHWAAV